MKLMTNLIQTGESPASPQGLHLSGTDLVAQLLSLRHLLQEVALSMCADDVDGVGGNSARIVVLAQQASEQLQNTNSAGAALYNGEELRRALLKVVEARAFFAAALRRWRRAMRLREASLSPTREPAGYGEGLTRWA